MLRLGAGVGRDARVRALPRARRIAAASPVVALLRRLPANDGVAGALHENLETHRRRRMNLASRWTSVALAAALVCSLVRAQTTTRVSLGSGGAQGDQVSAFPSISVDGRFVAFQSTATNLVEGDTNEAYDVFVHDRQTG